MISALRQFAPWARSAFLACLCAFSMAWGGDLVVAAAEGSLWGETSVQLAQGTLKDAVFRRVDDHTFRFQGSKKLTLAGIIPRDVVIRWDDDVLHALSATSTFYNKGDDGPLDKIVFEKILKARIDAISTVMQSEPVARKVDKKEAGIKPRAWEWSNDFCAILLEAHSTGSGKKFVSEFIRLTIVPSREDLERGGADNAAHRDDLKQNVQHESDGSVWITGIPMVDQGEKGYCVPATLSRVFAYYNMDGVDQHALAALCKSSGEEGTSIEAMSKALSSIAARFHMGVTSWRWVNKKTLQKDYEKIAMRKKVFSSMLDPKLLLEAINSKPAVLRKGLKDIRKYIDAGIPIVWGVILGLYPEQGLPQSAGGHMRLIIGYNEQTQMIIYSDSWGAGHEAKVMALDRACAISQILYVLRPLR